MSVIKGTFFSRFESAKSVSKKNERLLFVLNKLSKIKKNAKNCKKVLHLYVPFFTDKEKPPLLKTKEVQKIIY